MEETLSGKLFVNSRQVGDYIEITMPKATYKEMGCTTTNEAGAGLIDFGEFNLVEGTNEFTLAATNSYGLLYWDFIIAA